MSSPFRGGFTTLRARWTSPFNERTLGEASRVAGGGARGSAAVRRSGRGRLDVIDEDGDLVICAEVLGAQVGGRGHQPCRTGLDSSLGEQKDQQEEERGWLRRRGRRCDGFLPLQHGTLPEGMDESKKVDACFEDGAWR